MSLINWSESMHIGCQELDYDHEKFAEVINNLHEAIENKSNLDDLEDAVEDLVEYTEWHFRHEERLMLQSGYELMEDHKQVHEEFTAKVNEIRGDLVGGGEKASMILSTLVADWSTHLVSGDKPMCEYLADQDNH